MKKLFVLPFMLLAAGFANAQAGVADAHKEAMEKAGSGNFDKALAVIKAAETNYPNNEILLRDEASINTWNKKYPEAITAAKKLFEVTNKSEESFQILGSAYRAAAKYSEAEDVYKKGIEQFPENAMMYAEYGQALNDNNKPKAAKEAWENGIQVNPSISSNYYFLTKYYATHNNPLWSVLYGETFINIESFTRRTSEARDTLLKQYSALFATDAVLQNYIQNGNPFESAVASTFAQFKDMVSDGVFPESLYALRGQFIVNWFNSANAKTYPFKLFDRQQHLLKLGVFEAYNQWLFAFYNPERFKNWGKMHEGVMKEFSKFQQASLFKVPKGEYYPH